MQEVKEMQGVDYESVLNDFVKKYPQYSETVFLDALRKKEFSRIEANNHTYLDFVGSNLYPASLVKEHHDFLLNNIYGNPHSENPTSSLATSKCEHAREYVKKYFNDIKDEYCVVFTSNASGALKLVGESYPLNDDACYLLTADNHNSVNGIREFSRKCKTEFIYAPISSDGLQIDEDALNEILNKYPTKKNKLYAFPAQSNFSGVKHDLGWIEKAQSKGWDVLLDAAAYVPTNKLDLSIHKPEFVSISFYKMFGYPTGIGCLLMKKSVLPKMKRPWFAGGTIEVASVGGDGHYLADNEVGFEDGTINFLNIPAVEMGLKFIESIGMKHIQTRTYCLTDWTINQIKDLSHNNGTALIDILGTTDLNNRGATITFNVIDKDGNVIFYEEIEKEASSIGLSLRAGCFCNPGADETASHISAEMLRPIFESGKKITYAQFVQMVKDKFVVGAVRASFGYVSNFKDAYRLVSFIKTFQNR